MNKKLLKDCCLLVVVIILAAAGARFMAGGETLEEYAKEKASTTSATLVSSDEDAAADLSTGEESTEGSTTEDYVAIDSGAEASTNETVNINAEASINGTVDSGVEVSINGTVEAALIPEDRVTLSDGFYYESIPQQIINRITGVSYVENDNISLDDLRYCVLMYNDFNGESQKGELICNEVIADDILEIFYELYSSGYQIESIKLVDEFNGDDTASMLANNTSCFNYRVVENTDHLSKHAYGLAIDLNPFYNPYITYNKDGTVNISPEVSEAYADRSDSFPYKIDENDLAYKLFKDHGFKWGGDWNSVKDYQHFER